MNLKTALILACFAIVTIGCNAGETPTETVKIEKVPAKKDSMTGAIQGNPNMPDDAKQALLGGGKK